jgi:hypothetical protein
VSAFSRFFLRAPHWQIFVLTFGTMLAGQIVLFIQFAPKSGAPAEAFVKINLAFTILTVAVMFPIFGWFWAMGSFLTSIVRQDLRLKIGFFRFAVLYPALYLFFFLAVFQSNTLALVVLIVPLHLLAMFCMFYNLYFVSKSLTLAETNKPASFYDYAGPFFLNWFFPIGVWIIQPRINRLYQALHKPTAGIAVLESPR